jgi:class 3 adenylate cyclase/tetratricopeptide (TPR) repeat protein
VAAERVEGPHQTAQPVRVQLLGPFTILCRGSEAGPWPRPSAKHLCELVFVSPGRRVSRDAACDVLFADLVPEKAARALTRALSMARGVLARLGGPATGLLEADRASIWASRNVVLDVDLERNVGDLMAALGMGPGSDRDDQLVAALAEDAEVLVDEPFADWALPLREHLAALRQQARLVLARDRAKGAGRSRPAEVVAAWESCLGHDPACEEAAEALIRAYSAEGLRHLVVSTYERCRAALDELGLRTSPALEEVHAAAVFEPAQARALGSPLSEHSTGLSPPRPREERKTVSVLFAEVATSSEALRADPEDLRQVVGEALTRVINEVEGLGGTVTSVSGGGLQALFGAPEAHEDDPERALRAAFRALSAQAPLGDERPSVLRIGVETGAAVVGQIGAGARFEYGAVGAVVGTAAALQSVAKPGSALVGPVTRAAVEGLFEWGATEVVTQLAGAKPFVGSYLEQPKARAPSRQMRLGGRGPLVGRQAELSVLDAALRDAEGGMGSVVVLVGEPGLGKTRLVQECRKRFIAWVGARSGRLPLWLEGRCASYASTTPYGLYQHLLASWMGVAPDQAEAVVGPALDRALTALMGNKDLWPVLARMMGLPGGASLVRMSPLELQKATFGALRAVISRLAGIGPTVLALEDLHWADPTSLLLTEELSSMTANGPLLLVLTRRPDPDPGVSALEAARSSALSAKLRKVELGRLAQDAERELVKRLAGEVASDKVMDAVLWGVEGNPLFLEERLFSMMETGALVREQGAWQLGGADREVPQVLERLVRSRVDHLSLAAQEVVRAASVLGTDLGLPLLRAVCEAGDQLGTALAELLTAGLLEPLAGAPKTTYRFHHALIQEATYRGMLRPERRQLHGRAAWALEAMSEGRLEEVAAVIGNHFAAADQAERAVHYLEMAGDHALRSFANDEAITSFHSALAIADNERQCSAAMAGTALLLRRKLAQVLWRIGRRGQARQMVQDAIGLAGPNEDFQRARIQILIGQMELDEQRYPEAEAAYDSAEELLGERPWDGNEATVAQWLDVMVVGRAQLYLQRKEPGLALAVLDAARPVLELKGSESYRDQFHRHLAWQQALERGWLIDEEVIANARTAAAAASAAGDDSSWYEKGPSIAWAALWLGFFLMLRGELEEAREQLETSQVMAERSGDVVLQAAALFCLVINALRNNDVESVRSLAPKAVVAGEVAGYAEMVSAATACLAWLARQDKRPKDVLKLAHEAAGLWRSARGPLTFWKWLYLWPLVALHLDSGKVEEAVTAGREMLDPLQQRFPDELEQMLASASADWDQGNADAARDSLTEALRVAHELHYF